MGIKQWQYQPDMWCTLSKMTNKIPRRKNTRKGILSTRIKLITNHLFLHNKFKDLKLLVHWPWGSISIIIIHALGYLSFQDCSASTLVVTRAFIYWPNSSLQNERLPSKDESFRVLWWVATLSTTFGLRELWVMDFHICQSDQRRKSRD